MINHSTKSKKALKKPESSLVLIATVVIIILSAYAFTDALEFNRKNLINGEYWRLITAHFTHTTIGHLLANLAASLLIYFLVLNQLSLMSIILSLLINSLTISAYLFYFQPELQWYTGLSGLLHALIVIGCFFAAGQKQPYYWTGAVLVWLKVTIEQYQSPTGYFNDQFDIYVITAAHFAGALSGTVYGGVLFSLTRKN